jgi:hypothetical protein
MRGYYHATAAANRVARWQEAADVGPASKWVSHSKRSVWAGGGGGGQ